MESMASLTSNKNQCVADSSVVSKRRTGGLGLAGDPRVLPIGAQSDKELTEKLGFRLKLKTSAWQKAQ